MLSQINDSVVEFWNKKDLLVAKSRASETSADNFIREFAKCMGSTSDAIRLFQSARRALRVLLETLQLHYNLSSPSILLPKLTCPVVMQAALTAGWQIELFDNGPAAMTWREVSGLARQKQCDAILVTHLYGCVAASRNDVELLRQANLIVIEDCAHCLVAENGADVPGNMGDYAIFSFNYDKPISLGGGGAVKANTPSINIGSAKAIETAKEMSELNRFIAHMKWRRHLEMQSGLYLKVVSKCRRLWKKFQNIADSGSGFEVSGVGPVRSELGIELINRYPEVRDQRIRNAKHILNTCNGVFWTGLIGSNENAWIKLRMLGKDTKSISQLRDLARANGIRVGNFNWPRTLQHDDRLFPIAEKWSARGIDVPIHQNLTEQSLNLIVKWLNTHIAEV
jgi:dTDP-4-amino-4,6-dideoxygalactose transaminase